MAEFLINYYINSLRLYLSIIVLSASCVWLLKYNWNRRKLYKASWQLNGPLALPILGNALTFIGSMEDIVTTFLRMAKTYGSPVRIWLANKLFVYVSEPKDLEIILNHKNLMDKSDLYDFFKPVLNNGLLNANGEMWRAHRKMLNPTFNQTILNSFVVVFDKQSRILVENMKDVADKGKFDIYEYIFRYNIHIVSENLMGIKVKPQENESKLIDWLNRVTHIIFLRVFRPWYFFDVLFNLFPISKKLNEYIRKSRTYAYSIVKQRRLIYEEHLNATEPKPESDLKITKRKALLDYMLEMGGTTLTDSYLTDEVLTFLLTGSDTTASALSFTLMMLGAHPDIQIKVYKEVVDVLGNTDRPIVSEDLSKLKYLERVIKETMRLFPVALIITRAATDDVKLTTCTLPKGATVAIGLMALHRDPILWPDPLKFNPDRFLPEEIQKRHPYAYIPFSGGPRSCIAFRYAMMSMKLFLATFLRTYRVKQDLLVKDIRLEMAMLLKPIKGYMLETELRNGEKKFVKLA